MFNDVIEINGKLESNSMKNVKLFYCNSDSAEVAVFNNVPIAFRVSALFIGNANGFSDFRSCGLFSMGEANSCTISSGTISCSDNGDGTANITISCTQWGIYWLMVFY